VRRGDRFGCEVCGKPLGTRRVRQGLAVHPGCRRSLAPAEVERALALARGALRRLPRSADDPELSRLLALAARQARDLIGDLARLRSCVGGAPRESARTILGSEVPQGES
jgi:hypothetical protein